MRAQVLAALRAILVFTVLLGLAYPLAITGVSQVFFNDKADGSLVKNADGEVVGSKLLGQTFTSEDYVHGRPSAAGGGASGSEIDALDDEGNATGETVLASPEVEQSETGARAARPRSGQERDEPLVDLSTAASGPSNLGPTNEDLLAMVQERIDAYRDENGVDADAPVPVDAVTASASGVDPSISITNARLQAPRVADARGMSVDDVLALVDDHTSSRTLGFLGEKGVNVLELNLALDEVSPS
jgi:K+-transporting ATPase ATPase C chain